MKIADALLICYIVADVYLSHAKFSFMFGIPPQIPFAIAIILIAAVHFPNLKKNNNPFSQQITKRVLLLISLFGLNVILVDTITQNNDYDRISYVNYFVKNYVFGVTIFIAVVILYRNRILRLLQCIILGLLPGAIVAFGQLLDVQFFWNIVKYIPYDEYTTMEGHVKGYLIGRVIGLCTIPVSYAYVALYGSMITYSIYEYPVINSRNKYGLLTLLFSITLLGSGTRSGIFALVFFFLSAQIFYIWKYPHRRKTLLHRYVIQWSICLLLTGFILFVKSGSINRVLTFSDDSSIGRIHLMSGALEFFKSGIITGVGTNNTKHQDWYYGYVVTSQSHFGHEKDIVESHVHLMNILLWYGYFGFLLCAAIYIVIFVAFINICKSQIHPISLPYVHFGGSIFIALIATEIHGLAHNQGLLIDQRILYIFLAAFVLLYSSLFTRRKRPAIVVHGK